jgi:hypothetical protein
VVFNGDLKEVSYINTQHAYSMSLVLESISGTFGGVDFAYHVVMKQTFTCREANFYMS